jgi:hypothetical protein
MTSLKKIVAFVAVMLLGACTGPKIIPDGELVRIFHDIYLVNAYVDYKNVKIDSLNIYEPVLASYGYTSEDLQYTIGNFAKRKSARLADDVVEPANQMLLSESRYYHRRIEIADTVRLIAGEKFAEQVYVDSLIRVRRIADTSRLRITIPDIRPGSYKISYGYMIDSLDRNTPLVADFRFLDSAGHRTGNSTPRLTRGERSTVSTTIASTSGDRRLMILLNKYSDDLSTPDITIDSLRVTYYLPDDVAVSKLVRSYYVDDMLDSLFTPLSESHATHLRPPLIDTARTRIR